MEQYDGITFFRDKNQQTISHLSSFDLKSNAYNI